jgi:hypothetical protein
VVRMYYKEKETPNIHGIMFSETTGNREETTWYNTKDERDYAIEYLLEYGRLEISIPDSPVGRTIVPHAFTAIDANDKCYQLI